MPIYEYNCQDCKQIFEDWQKDYEERDIPCPVCNGKASRLISSTSFVLKGGGWYASGYNSDRPAPPESASAAGGASTPAPTASPCACAAKAEPAETKQAAPAQATAS